MRSISMRSFIEKTGSSRRPRSGNRNSMTMPSRVRDLKKKTLRLVPSSENKLNVIFVDDDSQDQDEAHQFSVIDSDEER